MLRMAALADRCTAANPCLRGNVPARGRGRESELAMRDKKRIIANLSRMGYTGACRNGDSVDLKSGSTRETNAAIDRMRMFFTPAPK